MKDKYLRMSNKQLKERLFELGGLNAQGDHDEELREIEEQIIFRDILRDNFPED